MEKLLLPLVALSVVAATGFLPASAGQVNPVAGEPTPVSAIFDGYEGFSALTRVNGVGVYDIGDRTYAVLAAEYNAGVQIIDISDPARPSPVSSVFNGSGGFDALGWAADVEVYGVENRTYAVVAAWFDQGVQIMDITDPENPVPVSAVFDSSGGFDALNGATDVEVFSIDRKTYGIVAAVEDDGVQIMDITDPENPVPVSSVFDGSGGFDALLRVADMEVYDMRNRTYAVAASVDDDGVQIMDITDPENPVPVSAVFDSSKGFDALGGAVDVEVYSMRGNTYGIVAAWADKGVQIMDITDPENPVPVSAVFDSSKGFDALGGANDVEVFSTYGRTYAILTADGDGGVQIMDITDPENPVPVSAVFDGSGGFDALGGAVDVEVYNMGGSTYGIVAARSDNGVQIMDISDPAYPIPISAVFEGHGGFSALSGATDVEVYGMGGSTYGIVASVGDSGVQIMDITDPENPAPVSAVFNGARGFDALGGAADVEVYNMGGSTYGIVAALYGIGIQVMNITDPENPVPVSSVFDGSGGFDALNGPADVEVFSIDRKTYGIVAAWIGGVQIMDITDPENPAPVSAVFDGSGGFDALELAYDVEVHGMSDRTYGIVAARHDNGVQIMDITDPENPAPVSAVFDGSGGFDALGGAVDVEVFSTDGKTYAAVAARDDNGVQIMDITDPENPAPVSAVFDSSGGFDALNGANDVEVYDMGGSTYGIVASMGDGGVQIMDITDPENPAPVSAVFDYSEGFRSLYGAVGVESYGMEDSTYGIVASMADGGVQIMNMTPPSPRHLEASVGITGHERIPYGDNDFVQIAVEITNHGNATLANDNQDGTPLSGELHISLNALKESHPYIAPSCDAVRGNCTWSNGEYIAYYDMARGQAEEYGAAVSEDDCTSRDDWSVRRGETTKARFCYWVDAEFEPESMQFYHAHADSVRSVPFLEYGSCYLPYMLCNESALTPLNHTRIPPP